MTKADILKALDDLGWMNTKTDDNKTMVRQGVALVVAMVILNHISQEDLDDVQRTINAKLTADQDGPGWLTPAVH